MDKDIVRIKKNGKLLAFDKSWQYWLLNDIVYSVNVEGTHCCLWCATSRLNIHLHRLYQIMERKFFTENSAMCIIDKDFFSQYAYA